jgi:hypothetical protein
VSPTPFQQLEAEVAALLADGARRIVIDREPSPT